MSDAMLTNGEKADVLAVRRRGLSDEITDLSTWEKSARTLSLNTRDDLIDLVKLLKTLCRNIVANPAEPKYRSIKLNNKALEIRLLGRKGGLEFLAAIGFKTVVVDAVRTMEYPCDEYSTFITAGRSDAIEDGLSWLDYTVDCCIGMADACNRLGNESCAECVMQLRMPTGIIVAGGFARTDLCSSILSFACCYFRPDKYDSVVLRFMHDATFALSEEELEKDLDRLNLAPRATLVVTVQPDDARAEALTVTQGKVSTEIIAQKLKTERLRKERLATHKLLLEDREKTMIEYKTDREKKKLKHPTTVDKLGKY